MSSAAPTLLDALRAVEALQERRVAVWHEYDDAMNAFFAAPPAPNHFNTASPLPNGETHNTSTSEAIPNGSAPHSCAEAAAQGQGHGHGVSLAPDAGTISEITRIVASGLLESGHELRAIQTQLRLPVDPAPEGPERSSLDHLDRGFGRPDLAQVLEQIQSSENALLRITVERDQRRRTEHLASGQDPASLHPPPTWFSDAQANIRSIREDVHEAMQELAAEKAEVAL